MSPQELRNQLANDPSEVFAIVAINNRAELVQALMADNLLFGDASEQECIAVLDNLYAVGEYKKIDNVLSQVEYLRNDELPAGYDSVLLEGMPVRRNALSTGSGSESTGINWSDIINNVITTVGSNIGDWTGQTGNDGGGSIPAPAPAPAPQDRDYTPYLIGGGALALLIILIVVMRK